MARFTGAGATPPTAGVPAATWGTFPVVLAAPGFAGAGTAAVSFVFGCGAGFGGFGAGFGAGFSAFGAGFSAFSGFGAGFGAALDAALWPPLAGTTGLPDLALAAGFGLAPALCAAALGLAAPLGRGAGALAVFFAAGAGFLVAPVAFLATGFLLAVLRAGVLVK